MRDAHQTLTTSLLVSTLLTGLALAATDPWSEAAKNGEQSQRVIKFCNRYVNGWLSHADPATGLLPRTTKGEAYWNAKDCAADNYPFIVLTACVTDNYYLKETVRSILTQEQKLTNRLDALPDDFDFATGTFRTDAFDLNHLIFGASEYAKDGLMPITEWIGVSPWLGRMERLIQDIWKHAPQLSLVDHLPSTNVEVNGELLQVMSRLYWITRNDQYRTWAFQIADHYLLHDNLLEHASLRLRDHGCEVIGGLSEAYVVAAHTDPSRRERYSRPLYALLDRVLEIGINEDGLMYNIVNPRTGKIIRDGYTDTWGYVYDAHLTVAEVDNQERYTEAVSHALRNIHKYVGEAWEGIGGADGYADAIEGAINLLNRIPVQSAFQWVDTEMCHIFEKQRHDGIIEGWYGDGNSARTAIMYALWKTQGLTVAPWREDLRLGAVLGNDGSLYALLSSEWAWRGHLKCDRPRHHDILHLPLDYPRINQFPEWFTVSPDLQYTIRREGTPVQTVSGDALLDYELQLEPGEVARIQITPATVATQNHCE